MRISDWSSDVGASDLVKLPAGDLVIYPSSSLHRVEPVTRGARLASFLWVQSLIRNDAQRRMLFELDASIQAMPPSGADRAALLQLTGLYHNLPRPCAEPSPTHPPHLPPPDLHKPAHRRA